MDDEASRLPFPQDLKRNESASASSNNTRSAQAQTQDSLQPLEYLQKGMDSSLGSRPSTPASSGCFSRSSTIESFSTRQSQGSENTFYSQTTPSSDDKVSVSRSLTFPATGPFPADPWSLPNGKNIRLLELSQALFDEQHFVPSIPRSAPVSIGQSTSCNINRYWLDKRIEEAPVLSNQVPPSRYFTFPIEKSSSPTMLDWNHSFDFEEARCHTAPELTGMDEPLPQGMVNSGASRCLDFLRRGGRGDEFRANNPWTKSIAQRRQKPTRSISIDQGRKAAERAKNPVPQYHESVRDGPHRTGSSMSCGFSCASTVVTKGAVAAPESTDKRGTKIEETEVQEHHASSPKPPNSPRAERSRSSSRSRHDDNAGPPDDEYTQAIDEDEDSIYEGLVEGITNLILESSCVGNVEDQGIPVKLYVHNLLESIMNHPRSPSESRDLCLPIRNLPLRDNETPDDTGESSTHYRGQPPSGGSYDTNKRSRDDQPGKSPNNRSGNEDRFDGGLDGNQTHNHQKSKKQKTAATATNLSCPFRKRNPIRFNVRDHEHCALKPFMDFALLKRHIKTNHKNEKSSSSCVRCKKRFRDKAALKHHLTQRDFCQLLESPGDEDPEDPEEGITDEVEQKLKVRTSAENVRDWHSLWKLLFPNDPPECIPSSEHELPVELDEVQNHSYNKETVREFIRNEIGNNPTATMTLGFRYIPEVLRHCRTEKAHEASEARLERDQGFLAMVNNELSVYQHAPEAHQHGPMAFYDPTRLDTSDQWGNGFGDLISMNHSPIFAHSGSSYFTGEPYTSHQVSHGFQNPVPMLSSSQNVPAQYVTPPSVVTTTLPLGPIFQEDGHLHSAAGGSTHHSSRPSSRSHDPDDQTQETPDTPYTQEQDMAVHPSQCLGTGKHGDQDGACTFCMSPGGVPPEQDSCTGIPGQSQDSSEHELSGVGTSMVMPTVGRSSQSLAAATQGTSGRRVGRAPYGQVGNGPRFLLRDQQ